MFSGVNLFAIYTGLGAAIGTWQVVRRIPEADLKRRFGFVLAVLLGVLLGARAGYVLFHTDYYGDHRARYPILLGGMEWIAPWRCLFVLSILGVSREPLASRPISGPWRFPRQPAHGWLLDSGRLWSVVEFLLGFEVPNDFESSPAFPLQLMAVLCGSYLTGRIGTRPP